VLNIFKTSLTHRVYSPLVSRDVACDHCWYI